MQGNISPRRFEIETEYVEFSVSLNALSDNVLRWAKVI
jgi:hypothetical protein